MSNPPVAQARSRFVESFGTEPEGVWEAPGRINLIGEHTDYSGGLVLPFALAQTARVALRRRDDLLVDVVSEQLGRCGGQVRDIEPGQVSGWSGYALGPFWALRSLGVSVPGVDLYIDSQVPMGAGLSSSAALQCALLLALRELLGLSISDLELAKCVQRVETEFAGVPCGLMDPLACLCAKAGQASLIDCADHSMQSIPLELSSAGAELWVIDTCAPHQLSDGHYAARRRDCEALARHLGCALLSQATREQLQGARSQISDRLFRRGRHVLSENARVREATEALEQGRMTTLGELLTASHASLRNDFEVTIPELDLAVEAALAVGAHGARMIGGGFGGSVLALVPEQRSARHVPLETAVNAAYSRHAFGKAKIWKARVGEGARRLR